MLKVVKVDHIFQIHSITARTTPLEFRETLKKGKPVQTDSILRLQDLTPPDSGL